MGINLVNLTEVDKKELCGEEGGEAGTVALSEQGHVTSWQSQAGGPSNRQGLYKREQELCLRTTMENKQAPALPSGLEACAL